MTLRFSSDDGVEHLSMGVSSLEESLSMPPMLRLGCFLVLSYMSCLHNLKINPMTVVSFAIIVSHSEGCLFMLFIVSFTVQKVLSLFRSNLLIFVFISITLESKLMLL